MVAKRAESGHRLKGSLKSQCRENRGTVTRKRLEGNTTLPKNWAELLLVDEIKRELFAFLSEKVRRMMDTEKEVIQYVRSVTTYCQTHHGTFRAWRLQRMKRQTTGCSFMSMTL